MTSLVVDTALLLGACVIAALIGCLLSAIVGPWRK